MNLFQFAIKIASVFPFMSTNRLFIYLSMHIVDSSSCTSSISFVIYLHLFYDFLVTFYIASNNRVYLIYTFIIIYINIFPDLPQSPNNENN